MEEAPPVVVSVGVAGSKRKRQNQRPGPIGGASEEVDGEENKGEHGPRRRSGHGAVDGQRNRKELSDEEEGGGLLREDLGRCPERGSNYYIKIFNNYFLNALIIK